MKKTKTSYKMYPAWEFDREVTDLDEQSRKGWQLKKGGCFHSKYYFDDSVQYRYALDFNQHVDDPLRYRETFADQGWEFINSTFNGWHYFRKAYDPSLPEEEYQIYTDTASRQEMAGRWKKLAYILGGMELAVSVLEIIMNFRHPHIFGICVGLAGLLLGLLLIFGARRIGFPARRKALVSGKLLILVIVLFIVGFIFGIPQAGFTTQTEYIAPEDDSFWHINFEVKMPDFYTLDLDIDAEAPATVCLVKEGETGGVLYTAHGEWLRAKYSTFLMPGFYYVSTQYDPGTEPGTVGTFHYELN